FGLFVLFLAFGLFARGLFARSLFARGFFARSLHFFARGLFGRRFFARGFLARGLFGRRFFARGSLARGLFGRRFFGRCLLTRGRFLRRFLLGRWLARRLRRFGSGARRRCLGRSFLGSLGAPGLFVPAGRVGAALFHDLGDALLTVALDAHELDPH